MGAYWSDSTPPKPHDSTSHAPHYRGRGIHAPRDGDHRFRDYRRVPECQGSSSSTRPEPLPVQVYNISTEPENEAKGSISSEKPNFYYSETPVPSGQSKPEN